MTIIGHRALSGVEDRHDVAVLIDKIVDFSGLRVQLSDMYGPCWGG